MEDREQVTLPPKQQKKMGDNPDSSSRPLEGATAPQVTQSHNFKVKRDKDKKHKIFCEEPCTVLEAIKSDPESRKLITCEDNQVIIQLGEQHMKNIIATHFPCTCIDNGQTLVIHISNTMEENIQDGPGSDVLPTDRYSVFYIDTMGGDRSKSKPLFVNNAKKKNFKFLCVYGVKGTTVEDTLNRDGRFIDDLGDFFLTDNDSGETIARTVKVEMVHQKELKINIPEGKVPSVPGKKHKTVKQEKQQKIELPSRSEDSHMKPGESEDPENNGESRAAGAQQREVSAGKAAKSKGSGVNTKEIYELLCRQFKGLKEWMEERFPGNSYQEALNVRKEKFGKIQQSFSEVYRMKELFKLGESICLLKINVPGHVVQGTGFVLFDNFVLTNAHLFEQLFNAHLHIEDWHKNAEITATFNYEYPPEHSQNHTYTTTFKSKELYIGAENLDYAILELETPNPGQTTETMKPVPPGLLRLFAPPPESGEACVIGHLKGELKTFDPICIIEKENREQAVNQNLYDYKDHMTLCSINQAIKNDPCTDVIVTYNSFMYHGSSGSPVFDACGRVFGLHTGGYFYGFPKAEHSLIEYAGRVLPMFEEFVCWLIENGKTDMLLSVQREAEGNPFLEYIIKNVSSVLSQQIQQSP